MRYAWRCVEQARREEASALILDYLAGAATRSDQGFLGIWQRPF